MCLVYYRVSPENAKLLLRQPKLIHAYLGAKEEVPRTTGGFWSRLFGGRSDTTVQQALEAREDGDWGDTDKSWQAIHYLITGTAEGGTFPENFIVANGRTVGSENVGYGPARLFRPEEVAQIAVVLEGQTEEAFHLRYGDGKKLDSAKVYPQIWGRDGEDAFAYAWENFQALSEFVFETRSRGHHLMLCLM